MATAEGADPDCNLGRKVASCTAEEATAGAVEAATGAASVIRVDIMVADSSCNLAGEGAAEDLFLEVDHSFTITGTEAEAHVTGIADLRTAGEVVLAAKDTVGVEAEDHPDCSIHLEEVLYSDSDNSDPFCNVFFLNY